MINKILRHIWKTDGMEFDDTPKDASASFFLLYDKFHIGTLIYSNNEWEFLYSDEFKHRQIVKPIIDFPDVNKTYKSADLWPFFAARIPAINQQFQVTKLQKAKVDERSAVALLKIFGNRTVTNPFRLQAKPA
jgi:HipA-like protein